jgi:hypothetical protein
MGDIYQSAWFRDARGEPCRIVYHEKGGLFYERLEYQDGRLDPFQWQGNLLCGFYHSKMGMRCIEVPQEILTDYRTFFSGLPRGTRIVRGTTTLVQI